MTRQEVFDAAVGGVLAQGRPSISEDGKQCLYRGPDGAKCAAGHLIPDELYRPSFETQSIDVIAAEALPFETSASFLMQLQAAHDAAAGDDHQGICPFLDQFRDEALDIARDYGLSTAVLDQAAPQ